jgi:hypothetical protein
MMLLEGPELGRLPRDTLIAIGNGTLADPTTLSFRCFATFQAYDAEREEVTFVEVLEPPRPRHQRLPDGAVLLGGDIRPQVTDPVSGLYVPESARRTPPSAEQRVALSENFFVLDGLKYAKYLLAHVERKSTDPY